ncbi:Sad1 / UNC-like C-terminal [Carex littledalei]|uniref:Sad1 / UNC-like C-terminal n=1 Tax=Carex littledalei TaxID=544730 RepID=A0A833R271_9POAL|nr:Sad1 / UNC-like C-terminal [Carex littledalei]
MQRSRRALLQRRAVALEKTSTVEKQKLYKVSLSVVLLLWVLIFMLNSLISHGNGYRDEPHDAVPESISRKEENLNVFDSTPNNNYENIRTQGEKYENNPAIPESEVYQNALLSEGENEKNTPSPKPILLKNEVLASEPGTIPDKENKETEEEREKEDEEQETKEVEKETKEKEKEAKVEEERETKEEQKVKKVEDRETKEEEREMNGQRTERISRITPLPLDEFKSKAIINSKGKINPSQTGTARTVVRRVEPSGKEYNYASQSKGAKVLAFNKEAKGASNILDKDKDKYLRNPCSVEGKFVIIELSEETLVDMIVIANFEHYSSNLRQFEVFSSLVYPTEKWDYIGEFLAQNSKHEQRFNLPEPRWVRYLKFNLLSHYGSEFYCTLSSIEVYGVDAVERMLENLISDEKSKTLENNEDVNETVPVPPQENVERDEPRQGINNFEDLEKDRDNENKKQSVPDPTGKPLPDQVVKPVPDPVTDIKALQVGRIPGDTVLKVLMQKVQKLDLNFSVLERYLEELNSRYGQIFKDFDGDMANFDLLLNILKAEIKGLQVSKETLVNELGDITDWKFIVSKQMEKYLRDSDILRSEVEKVKERQLEMENKGLAAIFVCFIFWSLAISKLLSGIIARPLLRFFG